MIKSFCKSPRSLLGCILHLDMENTSNSLGSDSDVLVDNFFILSWVQTIPLVLVTCVTLLANGAILVMFVTTKSLKRCRNIYIASLALADFLIGCTMPVTLVENVQPAWSLRGAACCIYLIASNSLLYVSLLSILLISIDRWWSINYPFSYRVRQSRRLVISTVTISWIISFTLHIPPVVIMTDLNPERDQNISSLTVKNCNASFKRDYVYILVSSVVEYLCPLLALWILNCSIYFRISRRKSMKIRRSLSVTDNLYYGFRKSSSESEGNNNGSDESSDLCPQLLPIGRRQSLLNPSSHRRHSLANCMSPKQQFMQYSRQVHRRVSFDISMTNSHFHNIRRQISRKNSMTNIIGNNGTRKQSEDLVREMMVKQDKKAACSLGMMVVVFTVCWTPHMVTEVINSKCGQCLPEILVTVTFWILVVNSAINPFLYGLLNTEYRKVLKQWVNCHNSRRKFRIKEAVMYWNIMPMGGEMVRDSGLTCMNAVKEWSS